MIVETRSSETLLGPAKCCPANCFQLPGSRSSIETSVISEFAIEKNAVTPFHLEKTRTRQKIQCCPFSTWWLHRGFRGKKVLPSLCDKQNLKSFQGSERWHPFEHDLSYQTKMSYNEQYVHRKRCIKNLWRYAKICQKPPLRKLVSANKTYQ